ncbi:MAG: MarR family winged helix-turn-helix transcriptional regulator, partial [Stellaceae bacterium]
EQHGRIERHPDAGDRRRSVLRLSPAGQALFRVIAPQARRRERQLLRALGATELAALDRMLARLVAEARVLPDGDEKPRRHRQKP